MRKQTFLKTVTLLIALTLFSSLFAGCRRMKGPNPTQTHADAEPTASLRDLTPTREPDSDPEVGPTDPKPDRTPDYTVPGDISENAAFMTGLFDAMNRTAYGFPNIATIFEDSSTLTQAWPFEEQTPVTSDIRQFVDGFVFYNGVPIRIEAEQLEFEAPNGTVIGQNYVTLYFTGSLFGTYTDFVRVALIGSLKAAFPDEMIQPDLDKDYYEVSRPCETDDYPATTVVGVDASGSFDGHVEVVAYKEFVVSAKKANDPGLPKTSILPEIANRVENTTKGFPEITTILKDLPGIDRYDQVVGESDIFEPDTYSDLYEGTGRLGDLKAEFYAVRLLMSNDPEDAAANGVMIVIVPEDNDRSFDEVALSVERIIADEFPVIEFDEEGNFYWAKDIDETTETAPLMIFNDADTHPVKGTYCYQLYVFRMEDD